MRTFSHLLFSALGLALPPLAAQTPGAVAPFAPTDAERAALISVTRIADHAGHSAFTDLVVWRGRLWCTFREGSGHVPGLNGVIRVLTSANGEDWITATVLDEAGVDLRDPKLAVTPSDRLMVWMGGSVYEGSRRISMTPRISTSTDGRVFTDPERPTFEGASDQDWLWRVTWHGGKAYGALLQLHGDDSVLHLMTSPDAKTWSRVTTWDLDGRPNETTLRALPDGRLVAVVRREAGDRMGRIGVAAAPFEQWEWQPLPMRLGGPELAVVPRAPGAAEGTPAYELLLGTREYGQEVRTILARVGLDGSAQKLLTLPSGGDSSYPGFVVEQGVLRMSYYSSHEGRTAVYLAIVRLRELLAGGR